MATNLVRTAAREMRLPKAKYAPPSRIYGPFWATWGDDIIKEPAEFLVKGVIARAILDLQKAKAGATPEPIEREMGTYVTEEECAEFMTSPEFDEMCAVCSIASDFVRKAHGIKGGVNG